MVTTSGAKKKLKTRQQIKGKLGNELSIEGIEKLQHILSNLKDHLNVQNCVHVQEMYKIVINEDVNYNPQGNNQKNSDIRKYF